MVPQVLTAILLIRDHIHYPGARMHIFDEVKHAHVTCINAQEGCYQAVCCGFDSSHLELQITKLCQSQGIKLACLIPLVRFFYKLSTELIDELEEISYRSGCFVVELQRQLTAFPS